MARGKNDRPRQYQTSARASKTAFPLQRGFAAFHPTPTAGPRNGRANGSRLLEILEILEIKFFKFLPDVGLQGFVLGCR